MAIFPARIDPNGRVIGSDRTIRLSLRNNDEAQFTSQGTSGPWTVVFTNTSPFSSATFTVPQSGNVRSGRPTVQPGPASYKYEVRNSEGRITDDPDILIDE
jgi:hypothetical protein